jgi:hypothetical protein
MLPSACSFIVDGRARKGNKSSEADSFRNIKVKHTHLKMAMYAETCSVEQRQLNVRPSTSTIKLHADGNITSMTILGFLVLLGTEEMLFTADGFTRFFLTTVTKSSLEG